VYVWPSIVTEMGNGLSAGFVMPWAKAAGATTRLATAVVSAAIRDFIG